jgi:hypothetical protein
LARDLEERFQTGESPEEPAELAEFARALRREICAERPRG